MRGGGRERFGRVYDEHVWRIYGFFGYRLTSKADAEDLTQLTFERALRAWDGFDPARASEGTWLISIARNLLVDHYRRNRTSTDASLDDQGPIVQLQDAAYHDPEPGLSPELAAALERLPDRDREIVALRFGGDLTGPEIAELTGLSLGNVQQILSRSLRKLRVELEPPAVRAAER